MNPIHKKVPVLIHKERPICESLILLEYIDEIFAIGSKLWTSASDEAKKAAKELVENLKTLEEELGEKPYFGGDTFSFVDFALIAFSSFFHSFETLGNFSMEAECPRLVAWANRCMERESVSKSLFDKFKTHEAVLGLKKMSGFD
ncbi:Glutathione S-transferase TAU 21, putative [Theobroma cacao]|uniref:glutathione transferase n=1 Tax=Theobroma cacao TaxID=3641 RepID=A0A061FGZ9_THECC|nr:Glutathione S-transferase TAU 21, putative [Theobroma cacao]